MVTDASESRASRMERSGVIPLPAEENRETKDDAAVTAVTAVVVQYVQDAIEDGHEVMYQLPSPKRQYRCFLQSLAADGVPRVPEVGGVDDPCP